MPATKVRTKEFNDPVSSSDDINPLKLSTLPKNLIQAKFKLEETFSDS